MKTAVKKDFRFIAEIIQRGRIKPAKFVHSLTMPTFLYEEMRNEGLIEPEVYFIDESAFFEFKEEKTTISFVTLFACEDLHRKIDHYLVVKFAGSYPIERSGVSKMNFDRVKKPTTPMDEKTRRAICESLNDFNGTGKTKHPRI